MTMKNQPAANSVANGSSEETQLLGINLGVSEPSSFGTDSAAVIRWKKCYGDLWKIKIAFDKEHNG